MVEKVTSLEVARKAGVSQSAVSRVFTPGASASNATRKKVMSAAEELGYRPNSLARAMITGQSRIIGLVVAYLENQFYPVVLELLSNALQQRGYQILIFTAPNSADRIDGVLQDLMDYQVDGIIAASVSMSSDLAARARDAGIPIVLFNRSQNVDGMSNVTSANLSGARHATEFLLAGGHTRIAHIAGWQGSSTGRDRQTGFLEAMSQAGKTPVAVVDGLYDRTTAMDCTYQLISNSERPDAIFVGNDHMAFGVLDGLRAEGILAGEDISVVGYDDVPLASWDAYNLTTIRQPVNRMVNATLETLLGQIEDNAAPLNIEMEGQLIVRTSARIPKGWEQ